jgi:3-oxoacyl-[acyl-carrier protein] reductase
MQLDTDFSSRVALVTGAAQGIGAEIARSFRHAGASVYLADMDADGLAAAAAELDADHFALDLSDVEATAAMVQSIHKEASRLDIVAHAAGGVRGQVGRPVEEVSTDDWHRIFESNVDAAFCVARAVAPIMKAQQFGRIINISSGAGLRPSLTGIQAYAAAKHALIGLTRQLSLELGPQGVTVNSVAPGLVLSNPSTCKQWASYPAEKQRAIIEATHTRRLGEPEDIAAAVLFLASTSASWISGQVLSVDGGGS